MKGNDQIPIPPEIEFLSRCIVAVSRSEYGSALQIMKAGLVELGQHGAPISNRQLAGALYVVFASLESNLKGAFGDGLEQKFKAFEPPEAPVQERCSFCGKERNEVEKMIAGPEVFICSGCVGICNEVLASDTPSGS